MQDAKKKSVKILAMSKEKGTETLAYKQSVLDGLVTTIRLNQRLLDPNEKATIDRLENSLTFYLKELVEHCKHEEIDLKTKVMKEVIAVLKSSS